MTNLPADLRPDQSIRGPLGTELMGVSVAIPVKEAVNDDDTPWDQEGWATAVRYYQPQMLDKLREHVGGARFRTEPQLSVDGPHSDPLQGQLYVMTVAAWFNPLELSVDCPAYRARSSRG